MRPAYEILDVHAFDNKLLVIFKPDGLDEKTTPESWQNVMLLTNKGEVIWVVNGMEDFEYWKKNRFVGLTKDSLGGFRLHEQCGFIYSLNVENGKVSYLMDGR